MSGSAPPFITHEEMQRHFGGGPQINKAVFALVGDRIYKNEQSGWRLLDNQVHASTRELKDDGPT